MPRLSVLALALAATGCAVGPNFQRPPAPTAQSYAAPGDSPLSNSLRLAPSASTPAEWWKAFGSEDLNTLVGDALTHNQTLAQADANLAEARAMAASTQGERAPRVDLNSGAQRERINSQAFGFPGFPNPTIYLYSLGANVGFDLDLFGGRRRASERDDAHAAAAQARVDAAYLTLSGNVVQQAVLISGLRAKLAAQTDIVDADQQILDMVHRAIQAGGQPRSAANAVQAQLAEDQAALPDVRQQLAEAQHHLALLLGRAPADMPEFTLNLSALRAPETIPVSLPSDLVRRRPDILAAEAELHAATADIGVETAALYPNIALSAGMTQSSITPADIFRYTSTGWSFGGALTAPVFHGGALRAEVHRANAAQRAALATYQETVLEAFVQVADVMQAVGNDQDSVAAERRSVAAADSNVHDTRFAYRAGAGALLSLLDAQRQASRARLAAIDARIDLFKNIAALYVATAADWREAAR